MRRLNPKLIHCTSYTGLSHRIPVPLIGPVFSSLDCVACHFSRPEELQSIPREIGCTGNNHLIAFLLKGGQFSRISALESEGKLPMFSGLFRKTCRKDVANIGANLPQKSVRTHEPVEQLMGLAFGDNQTSIDHRFQITLQRSMVGLGAVAFESLQHFMTLNRQGLDSRWHPHRPSSLRCRTSLFAPVPCVVVRRGRKNNSWGHSRRFQTGTAFWMGSNGR